MTTAVANPQDESLKQFLGYSIIMHASLAVVIAVSAYIQFRDNRWGGVGGDLGGTKVTLVSAPAAGIPMPKESVVTESKAVDPTKGLYKEEPKPKVPEPKTDATKIPKFEKEKRPPPSRPSRTLENKSPIPENAVPYGKRGNPDLPTGYSTTPGSGTPGTSVPGQGNADFATRYGWYIASAKRRVDPNWDLMSIDAAVRNSQTLHCEVSFTIMRDGYVKNVRVSKSSGNASWDNAGVRAILNSNPLPPLPSDFSGSSVDVIWDFPVRSAR
jgi:TonB family protein